MKRSLLAFVIIELGLILLTVLVRLFADPGWNDSVWLLWLPVLLPIVPILIWLRPSLTDKHKGTLVMLAWMVTGFSLHYAMKAFEKSTGILTTVQSVSDVGNYQKEKYFQIVSFEVDTASAVHESWVRRGGKYTEFLLIDLYFAVPFKDAPEYWYKLSFHKEIKVGDRERDTQMKVFLSECGEKLRTFPYSEIDHFAIDNSEEQRYFMKAIAQTGATRAVLLEPVYEPVGEGGVAGILLAVAITLGGLVLFAIVLFAAKFS